MNEVELTVDRIAVGGKGLGLDDDGRATFVAGSVPTERVVVRLTKSKKRFAEGEVVEVIEPSPDRVVPGCPHAVGERRCGGCDWQHISADGQRRLRVEMVEDALRRIGKLATAEIPIRSGPELPGTGYRTAVRMLAQPDGRLAYRQRASHEAFVPTTCGVAHPLLEDLIATIRCPGATEVSLRVSGSTGQRMVVTDTDVASVQAPPDVIVVNGNSPGDEHITETIDGVTLRISAHAFFQSSSEGAAALVEEVRRGLGSADRSGVLIDAYSGGGLFSATIGREWLGSGGSVIAIESNPAAVADARVNAPGAKQVESRFERWTAVRADAVIADPARSGLAEEGARRIAATGAARVVLVSCDAGALGRDAGLLTAHGYRLTDVVVLDLFNQTSHVEVVSTFVLADSED